VASSRNDSLARWRDLLRIRLRGRWRPAAVLMFVVAGALCVTTAINSKGLDLRAASVTDLPHVVRAERDHVNDLQGEVASLNNQISTLSHQVDNDAVEKLQRRADALRVPAGFAPAKGPGVTVVLDDAAKSEIDRANEPGGISPDELVVHQQDIQAVVNALWTGGATAITIQDQRVISTTGIKCVGNSVVLHGLPYSPPYRISAIGPISDLEAALDASEYVSAYKTFVEAYGLGYQVQSSPALSLAAYEGSSTLTYAIPGSAATPPARDE